MLNWLSRFNIFCFLDSQDYDLPLQQEECLAGVGAFQEWYFPKGGLSKRGAFQKSPGDWVFMHLGYGLKAETMGVKGGPQDPIGFPESFFFIPQYVLILRGTELQIGSLNNDHDEVYQALLSSAHVSSHHGTTTLKPRISREEYISVIKKLQSHILRGDCYEINFCQEFFAGHAVVDPLQVYLQLAQVSPNPFSAFYRHHDKYLMCASPERFIRKKGNRITSQPMKGTIARGRRDQGEDEALKQKLYESQKERSENVMVVDLVRNDLSMVCRQGTVKVDELFGIYPFPQVHQMISTISGELQDGVRFDDIIRACFPMGSMTGAPKKRVLELVDRYEATGRGLFSGSIGYMDPEGDLDLNVVIRSIFYNETRQYLNYLVGSGITHYSDAEKEYEECLLKSKAMEQALAPNSL